MNMARKFAQNFNESGSIVMNSDKNKIQTNTITSVESVIKTVLDDTKNVNNMRNISTGFRDLDNITNGFQSGDLIVLASRPSMGKTALALNIVANVALRNRGKTQKKGAVLYFSPELSKEKLVARMIAAEGKLDFSKLCSGNMTEEDMAVFRDTCSRLSKSNIFIDDSAYLT